MSGILQEEHDREVALEEQFNTLLAGWPSAESDLGVAFVRGQNAGGLLSEWANQFNVGEGAIPQASLDEAFDKLAEGGMAIYPMTAEILAQMIVTLRQDMETQDATSEGNGGVSPVDPTSSLYSSFEHIRSPSSASSISSKGEPPMSRTSSSTKPTIPPTSTSATPARTRYVSNPETPSPLLAQGKPTVETPLEATGSAPTAPSSFNRYRKPGTASSIRRRSMSAQDSESEQESSRPVRPFIRKRRSESISASADVGDWATSRSAPSSGRAFDTENELERERYDSAIHDSDDPGRQDVDSTPRERELEREIQALKARVEERRKDMARLEADYDYLGQQIIAKDKELERAQKREDDHVSLQRRALTAEEQNTAYESVIREKDRTIELLTKHRQTYLAQAEKDRAELAQNNDRIIVLERSEEGLKYQLRKAEEEREEWKKRFEKARVDLQGAVDQSTEVDRIRREKEMQAQEITRLAKELKRNGDRLATAEQELDDLRDGLRGITRSRTTSTVANKRSLAMEGVGDGTELSTYAAGGSDTAALPPSYTSAAEEEETTAVENEASDESSEEEQVMKVTTITKRKRPTGRRVSHFTPGDYAEAEVQCDLLDSELSTSQLVQTDDVPETPSALAQPEAEATSSSSSSSASEQRHEPVPATDTSDNPDDQTGAEQLEDEGPVQEDVPPHPAEEATSDQTEADVLSPLHPAPDDAALTPADGELAAHAPEDVTAPLPEVSEKSQTASVSRRRWLSRGLAMPQWLAKFGLFKFLSLVGLFLLWSYLLLALAPYVNPAVYHPDVDPYDMKHWDAYNKFAGRVEVEYPITTPLDEFLTRLFETYQWYFDYDNVYDERRIWPNGRYPGGINLAQSGMPV